MGIETATKISELNAAWPLGTDDARDGDNHIRLIKQVLQNDALSTKDGGTVNGTSFKVAGPVPRFENGGGSVIHRNTSLAANIGIWSSDILAGGTYQLTPRDSAEGVIAGAGGLQVTRNVSGILDVQLTGNNVSNTPPTGASVITRARGDNRYTLATSSQRYKDGISYDATWPSVEELAPAAWIWGGELAEDDPRIGTAGAGLIAEDVVGILPEAVTWNAEGRPEGINPLPLIALLVAELREVKTRLAALEG